ncbi:efflux RND transporter periplasmic adaptor subunit [Parapedobacter koreensis]|uniref:RND family efflux transporter, MFP subunit n=1 Tax=Parapedobacter koreensis TaxID=332977 RepID=A0A1H7QDL9_9SPHI|nr:efflux RND transporter periplasmic adaptor subunit [Parapedobacter koreensis]SEL45397.1 RND family efflux transporter, MFP subunit [Parapedobacter koreensis]
MSIRIVPIITLVATAAIWQACGSSNAEGESGELAVEAEAAPSIAAFELKPERLSSTLKIPGELIAYQQVDLYAKVSSFIKTLHADVGSEVQTGQLLATLEAPELNSQLLGAASRLKSQEATYLASKATYERLVQTSKTPGTVSQNDLDLALARQNADLAQLEAAKAAHTEVTDIRNYLEIRAPFSGVITARNVSAGAYVGPSGRGSEAPIFTLQDHQHLRLVVSVPESYTGYLQKNGEVTFTVKSLPSQPFTASVSRLAGALDTRLRSQRIEIDVNNNQKQLLPGMVAEVHIPLGGLANGFAVPSSAVLNSTQGIFVIKVEDNKAVWVPITKGNTTADRTEIFGDIKEGDWLIQRATEEIRNDSPVTATLSSP